MSQHRDCNSDAATSAEAVPSPPFGIDKNINPSSRNRTAHLFLFLLQSLGYRFGIVLLQQRGKRSRYWCIEQTFRWHRLNRFRLGPWYLLFLLSSSLPSALWTNCGFVHSPCSGWTRQRTRFGLQHPSLVNDCCAREEPTRSRYRINAIYTILWLQMTIM